LEKKIIIIGAGPAGLGAAYRLKELGYKNFHVYEKAPYIGGLASSFKDSAGFTWDIGGHVMFSHYKYYDDCFDKLMGDEYQLNMRESWVRMFDRWVPYPFQNNIRYLPKEAAFECLSGLIEAQTQRDHTEAKNFGEFIDAVFGDGIAKHFMRPYNFKVWAHPAELMNKEWIGERVAVLDINRALKNVILEQDDFGWGPNNQFKYPLHGGTGEFYRRFGPELEGHLTLGRGIVGIDMEKKQVRFEDGGVESYDILVSTMPLDKLCNDFISDASDRIREVTRGLRHSGGYMIGVGIKQKCPSTKSWMYYPEDNCPFYRVTYLSNYSPYMTPDNEQYYSLLCEISYSEFKPVDGKTVVDDCIQGLVNSGMISESDKDDIVDTWVYQADYSYPTPSVERDEILTEAIPYLERNDIYSRGRFGMWKYEVANTDHTLMQGVELIDRLLLGEPEITIGMKYASTQDGRQAAVHERSPLAGSGDPKKAAEAQANGHSSTNGNGKVNGAVAMMRRPKTEEPHVSEEELAVTQTKSSVSSK
jgi:protoporphyrinogen oxidase